MPGSNQLLNEETIPAYLASKAAEIGIFSSTAKITAKAIVGGNVNYAFRAVVKEENQDDRIVFVKQAPEFVAIFGPDGLPLTSDRMNKETEVYNEWRKLLGDELSKKYLPNIYLFDPKMMTFVMEFLDGYTLLDHDLVEDDINDVNIATIAESLGDFMGRIHAATHCSKLSKERVDYLTSNFENRAMRDIQLEYVFTKCYKEATEEQRAGLTVDDAFMKEIELLKDCYDGKCLDNLSLCHGDLHPGSVMVNCEADLKVIDPEFTVYGPPGLDVGSVLSGFVLGAVHQAYSKNSAAVIAISRGIEAIWNSYKDALGKGLIASEMIKRIEAETVGFTVAEVCRTALEFAGGRKWLQFEDKQVKDQSRKAALKIVEGCMTKRHEDGMNLLISEVRKLIE